MSLPRIYQIVSMDYKTSSFTYPIYINDYNHIVTKCPLCGCRQRDTLSILIQGYDEYKDDFDTSKPGFINVDATQFFTTWKFAQLLASKITGVKAVPVGYNDWDQQALPKEQYFQIEPKLGAIIVISKATAKITRKGKVLKRCLACGKVHEEKFELTPDNVLIDPVSWKGTDVFVIKLDYSSYSIITHEGIQKLKELGFDNLIYKEVYWSE